jgi:N-acetyl-D-muramate 6-phosphate phosphatase
MAVVSVVFDIGETLLDDSREFGAWADWIGVPRHTFSAVLGAVTAAGRDNAETFEYCGGRPDEIIYVGDPRTGVSRP